MLNLVQLSFVDLAGFEQGKTSGPSGARLMETQSIDQSLYALECVISDLSSSKSHIRYGDNQLTKLMSDSLGGNAKTLMLVNVSPAQSDMDETCNSLV